MEMIDHESLFKHISNLHLKYGTVSTLTIVSLSILSFIIVLTPVQY